MWGERKRENQPWCEPKCEVAAARLQGKKEGTLGKKVARREIDGRIRRREVSDRSLKGSQTQMGKQGAFCVKRKELARRARSTSMVDDV